MTVTGSMKLIMPIAITSSNLTSSTAADPSNSEVAWVSLHSYVVGNQVIVVAQKRKYECIVNVSGSTSPELDATHWADIGPSNEWAMFDRKIGTSTTLASPLTVVVEPGTIGGLALMECVGRQAQITYKDAASGTTVYTNTVSLDGTIIGSVYEWFFEDYEQLSDFVLTDLPAQFPNGQLTVSITATSGSVSCGVMIVGKVLVIGETIDQPTFTIIDYSIKEADSQGAVDVVERDYIKLGSFKVLTAANDFNRLSRRLASIRATPILYIGIDDELGAYQAFIIYGYFESFSIVVPYGEAQLCNLEIRGLI